MKHIGRCSKGVGLLAVLLILVQCAAPQPTPVRSFDRMPWSVAVDSRFEDGLANLMASQPWPQALHQPDMDWLLLGVRVQWDGRDGVWFVRVAEIIDPEEAQGGRRLRDRSFEYRVPFGVGAIRPDTKFIVRCRRLRIETYDAQGQFVAAWSRLVPEIFPEASLYQALATLPRPWPAETGTQWDPQDTSRVALGMAVDQQINGADAHIQRDCGVYEMIAMLQALGTTPPIAPIRQVAAEHIVQVPSLVTLLLSGLKPTATASMHHATQIEYPAVFGSTAVAGYQAEFATLLAGEKCFDCRVIAAPSQPPMHLLGGLLAIEAVNPFQPENRLTMRVLASSRSVERER